MSKAWLFKTNTGGRLEKPMQHSLSSLPYEGFRQDRRRKDDAGESLGSDCFPAEIWPSADAPKSEVAALPDIFFAGSFWVVSERVSKVLQKFNLGGGHLYPVRVLDKDKTASMPGPWFCLNVGNQKRTFIPELSNRLRKKVVDRWTLGGIVDDNDLSLSSAALSGPDIWIERHVRDAIFLSGPLGDAINETRGGKHFRLIECRIV